jgi:hypothetical protein
MRAESISPKIYQNQLVEQSSVQGWVSIQKNNNERKKSSGKLARRS